MNGCLLHQLTSHPLWQRRLKLPKFTDCRARKHTASSSKPVRFTVECSHLLPTVYMLKMHGAGWLDPGPLLCGTPPVKSLE